MNFILGRRYPDKQGSYTWQNQLLLIIKDYMYIHADEQLMIEHPNKEQEC